MNIKEIDQQYVAPTYKRFDLELVKGKGSIVEDETGKEYIDLTSGIGVTSFGLCDDEWIEAVTKQLGLLQHMSNLYYTDPCALLAQQLCEKTGMSKVFFGNSGAEANECAIKYARKYSAETKGPDCYNILTLQNSFHGRTLTTLAATGQDHYHELFGPLTPGFVYGDPADADKLIALAEESNVAGILMECIQGEGGVNVLEKDFVQKVAAYCKEKDIPLMIDEVQTGNGRTGEMYAYMNFGIEPDIVSTAKGLAGGLPMGACLVSEKVSKVLGFGDHGSTYGGNPICASGALTVVKRLTPEFLAEVKEKGAYVKEALTGAPGVESVDGLGLMIGIKTVKPAGDVLKTCMENGVLCLTAKTKVRLLPALNIPMDVLKKAVEVIREACAE